MEKSRDEILAEPHIKAEKLAGQSEDRNGDSLIEGPPLPAPRASRYSSPSSSDNEDRGRSPRRRRERSRTPERRRQDSPDGSPARKRRKMRSPGRWSRSPSRSPPRGDYRREYRGGGRDRRYGGRYRDEGGYRGGRDRYRGGRSRTPSPERRPRYSREEKDIKYNVVKEERSARTVFVQDLPLDVNETRIEYFFENSGVPVRDVQLVVDRNRKFKGMAYVEFYQLSDIPQVLKMSGTEFNGRPVLIEIASAADNQDGNKVQQEGGRAYQDGRSTQDGRTGYDGRPYEGRNQQEGRFEPGVVLLRLYVGNLDYGITQDMLKQFLDQYGSIESMRLQMKPDGTSKGHAFVQYWTKESAMAAFHALNATTLAGRQLRCDFTKDARAKDDDLPPSPPYLTTTKTSTMYYPGQTQTPQNGQQNGQESMGSLDDDVRVNNTNIHSLIQRLAASGTPGNNIPAQQQQIHHLQPIVPVINKAALPDPGTPSVALCLKNLFDPSTETNPNFAKEIELDVLEEAKSYGAVKHIYVDPTSFGDVYLKFEDLAGAAEAVKIMHGRFFDGRLVRAEYLPIETYEKKFA